MLDTSGPASGDLFFLPLAVVIIHIDYDTVIIVAIMFFWKRVAFSS